MADEIPNAVQLLRDASFRDWVQVGTCYHARVVLIP